MKKIYLYMLMALVAFAFSACSDSEDVTPSHADINKFVPAGDDQSVEAQLRRDFKEQTGSYLLFNDTLSKEKIGEDMYGKPVYKTELLDITYTMLGYGSDYTYTYDYLTTDTEKQKAANLVIDKLAKKIGKMMPYSVFLVNRINRWMNDGEGNMIPAEDSWDGIVPNPSYVVGARCYAISMDNGSAFDDANYFESLLEDIVYSVLTSDDSTLKEFYSAVENYNALVSSWKDEIGYEDEINDELARSLGFLNDYSVYKFAKNKEWETRQYLKKVMTVSQQEFNEEYAEYPICQSRYAILRNKMISLGFNFDE